MHIKCSGFLKTLCGTSLFSESWWFITPHYVHRQESRGHWVLFVIKSSEAKGKFFWNASPALTVSKWMKTWLSNIESPSDATGHCSKLLSIQKDMYRLYRLVHSNLCPLVGTMVRPVAFPSTGQLGGWGGGVVLAHYWVGHLKIA